MKTLFTYLLIFLFTSSVSAQQVDLDAALQRRPTELPIQVRLWELCNVANADNVEKMGQIMSHSRIGMRNDGKVNVRIIHPRDNRVSPKEILTNQSIEVFREDPEQTSIYIDPRYLIALAESLPTGYVLYQEAPADPLNEGPTPQVHNSASYSAGGAPGGAGIKIAVIDVGFNGLQNAIANGRAPANYDSIDYSSSGVLNGSSHGVAVIETVFDHAPNAQYFIYKVINSSQCASAVDQAVSDDVDIINMSLGYRGLGWEDDDNSLCTATNSAADAGILVFVSSGNSKKLHWQGTFSDNDNDNWHGWSGNNELNTITLQDTTSISCGCTWDPSQNTDYNIYIYNAQGTQILDSDEMAGTEFESVNFQNTAGFAVPVAIAVRKISGPDVEFEIQCNTSGVGSSVVNDQLTFRVAAGSITWPAACSADNVIGVAAVDRPDFNNPSGVSGISTVYSSEGPTNEGRQGVDITGATVTTIGGGGQFFGTSCSSPNAAGAAAALWSTQPNLNADNIRYLLYRKAQIYKDWGTPGLDYIYGWGGLYLHDYIINTKYVDRLVNNPLGFSSRVFQYVDDAFNAVPNPPAEGAVILFFNDYPSPYTPINFLMNKNVLLKTLGGESTLGNN
ncbi:MAG: S8 family serine peptidase [Bacteroidales bacterium]|nr:S8 family serine peptidase [Bacteroidales bacterium]